MAVKRMRNFYKIISAVLCIILMLALSSCSVVEGVLGNLGVKPGDPCKEGHNFAEEWTSDETHHWHAAICEHTDEVSDKAEHVYTDGYCVCGAKEPEAPHSHDYSAAVTAPTCTEGGYTTYTCSCGDSYVGDEVKALGHSYSDEWSKNDTHHWHAAICGHTDEVSDKAEHEYVEGVCVCGREEPVAPHVHEYNSVVTEPTCTAGGFTTYSCVCGDIYVADRVPASGHSYSDEWSKNETHHWHAATCGHTDEVSDKAEHEYAEGVCICGAVEPSAPHEHNYTEKVTDPTCDAAGYTTYTCACGDSYTVDGASATGHSYSDEWSKNADKHWHAAICEHSGLKSDEAAHNWNADYVCTDCGYQHEHSYSSAWSYDENAHWHAATCGHDVKGDFSEHFLGGDDACVSNCGYKYIAPHSHSYSTKWSKDENNHWRVATCEHEGEIADLGAHTYGDDDTCDVCGCIRPIVITQDDISYGGWGYSDKKSYSSSKPRIGTKELIFVKAGTVIRYDPKDLQIYLDLPTALTSNSSTAATDGSTRAGWFTTPGEYVVQVDAYLGITIAQIGGTTAIKPSQYNCDIVIFPGTGEVEKKLEKVNVYKFGGEGNDWCFVYLPEGYDPDRAEPYPFVIANHGNGWQMDGTMKKANWTDNTMYMSAAEIATQKESKRGRFIATEDPSLWYSNPTIEALLAAGYIVCGAQNYGDNLYGNDNCTNAVVDFFNHMVENYNVESACHMIGASNGAMTTLNAAEKLGDKVKSMIIQYPLASIITHYLAGGHRDNIEAAYGLDTSKTYTKAELEAVLADYDVLYRNVVDGVKQGYYPALKVYYSMTDTVTTANANAIPVIELLENSGKKVEGVRVDADGTNRQHGDSAHFDPEAFVSWFDQH